MIITSVLTIPLQIDLSTTPLAEYEYLINLYAAQNLIDPLDLASLILVESDGKPDAYNSKSKATGLGGVMPQEAGPIFKDRPTIEELKNPETNIIWASSIFAYNFTKAHSSYGALYQYSGGKYWKSVDEFDRVYWKRFQNKRQELVDAGARYKAA